MIQNRNLVARRRSTAVVSEINEHEVVDRVLKVNDNIVFPSNLRRVEEVNPSRPLFVNPSKIKLKSFLKEDEFSRSGSEIIHRIKSCETKCLGATVPYTIKEWPDSVPVGWRQRHRGYPVKIFFDADIFENQNQELFTLCAMYQNGIFTVSAQSIIFPRGLYDFSATI